MELDKELKQMIIKLCDEIKDLPNLEKDSFIKSVLFKIKGQDNVTGFEAFKDCFKDYMKLSIILI